VTDHGGLTATVGTYMKAAGKKPGDIFMSGFDMSAATVDAIKSGYENLVTRLSTLGAHIRKF